VAGCALVSLRAATGTGGVGDPGFAAAALFELGTGPPREIASSLATGVLAAPFSPGLLALREGALLEEAVAGLSRRPDVLLVHAAGRDHPRRAGLALMLGAVLGLPSFGVTMRPFLAVGPEPMDSRFARSPLSIGGEVVAYRVRTRAGACPVVAHAGWRTSPEVAADLALAASSGFRTPEPLRRALELARTGRGV
jgi:deoxyribonuclease V